MPMHISPNIDTDLSRAETMLPRTGPIANSLSPATQADILGILQREQDRAIALLSSSPLLTSLFVSYANQAAALESASATPSPESEEWKTLHNTIVTLREKIEKLESENIEVTEGLEATEASREAFRSQVSSLKEVNATQENDIKSLRAELTEAKEKYDRLMVDSNAEKAALHIRVLDLEAQRGELKEAIVEQQVKISKVGRQGIPDPPNLSTVVMPTNAAAYTREPDTPEGLNAVEFEPSIPSMDDRKKAAKQCGEERSEKEAQEKKEREERDRVEREEREVQEKREREEREERKRKEGDGRRRKEREEHEEREHKEQEERAEKKREEREAQEKVTTPNLTPEFAPEFLSRTTSGLLKTPKDVKEDVPTAPNPVPAPCLTPVPAPANIEPEKRLSLWEREKLKATIQPAPASSSPGGGGGNTESIARSTLVGDRQSILTDQKRENQRENLVEGFLGSNPARRRNDSAQSQMMTKPVPAPVPPPQKPGGWGSWGSSLLNNITTQVLAERSPSPEPFPAKPKIEDPPRGFVPNQPPKSQLTRFDLMDEPAWGTGGAGDNNTWGAAKTGPTPIAQKASTGPAWGVKPMGSTYGSGETTWGSGTGPKFGSNANRNFTVDTTTKPPENSLNTVGPEKISESAVETKRVPAPGGFNSSIMDKKEETRDAQDDAWGWEETKDEGSKKNSKDLSPIEKATETQTEETKELVKTEETATPAGEDEFDWAPATKKKKVQGQVASVAQTPYAPNTPDPDNADCASGGGGGGGIKEKKKKKKKRAGW